LPLHQVAQIVGRESELADLDEFLDGGPAPAALVLVGTPGAGKTTLWEAGIAGARARGARVLVARPTGADAQLSFAGLIDLLDGIALADLVHLPGPQRRALEAAILRGDSADVPAEPHAIRLAFLTVLRELAEDGSPLLLAIDDGQWLDASSAETLAFAARRLDGGRVRFLLARRRSSLRSDLERVLEPSSVTVPVGPLSLGAIRRLLAGRLGLTVHRQLLRRIVDTTLGNPLFALEIGRGLVDEGTPPVGEGLNVPEHLEDALGTRVARLAKPVRNVLLAVALSGDLRRSQLMSIEPEPAVDDAVEAGLVIVEGDRVRVSHPLLAAAATSRARPHERREMHRLLARVVADRELRALHLAFATDHPEERLSTELADAAAAAASRGATRRAVVLAQHAFRLAVPDSPERIEQLLQLAGYLELAGELQEMSALLFPEIDSLPAGPERLRALMLLSDGGANQTNDESVGYLDRALAESAGYPLQRAAILAKLVNNWTGIRLQRLAESEAWAEEALSVAEGEDPALERLALDGLSWARSLRGRPIDDLCDRFRAVSEAASYLALSPDRVAAQRLVWRGEIERARELLRRLWSLAEERGEPVSYALMRLHMCELELRAGGWDLAGRLLDEWAEAEDDELLLWPMYERCRALLAANRGLVDEAELWAARAIARAEATGVRWDQLEALRARGIAALVAGDPRRALDSLRWVFEYTVREGIDEPGVFPVAPDLVEALVETRSFDAARSVTERVASLAVRQEHPWGLATAKRCAAAVTLASSEHDERAADDFEEAADELAGLGLAFDSARTLLGLGRARRRCRKWAAARRSLKEAADAFDALGSPGWAERARSELDRVGARRPPASGELTAAEQRVVELATEGLSNKEIAQTLYVTVNTVEAHLSHAYAKLGVHSRAQLSRLLVDHRSPS
jgi:DNA-binding CsgD family transcriptional regulator